MTADAFIVCEDAGGAAALAPVVRALGARGARLSFCYGNVARATFDAEGIAVADGGLPEGARYAKRVLTASSCWGERLEARAILEARAVGVPSVSIVDFWSNYEARFSYPGETGLDALPDRVLAIDETMRAELSNAGVDEARITVTGSPAFDGLQSDGERWVRPGNEVVLFLSQPMAALYGEDERSPKFLGYTERTVLAMVAPMVADVGATLVVRPHPREDREALAAFVAGLPGSVRFDASPTLRDAIRGARVVTGMTTMGLVDAALRGAPAISIQTGRRGEDGLPTNRIGLTRGVSDSDSLRSALVDALGASPFEPRATAPFPRDATARVLAACDAVHGRLAVRS